MKSNGGSSFDNLALEFVRVTEVAAIAAAKWIGKGDGKAADKAAVDAMRTQFNTIDFKGEIVIGEGAKDESHELYIGEILGTGEDPVVDIAVDPLECTDSVANGLPNALTVIATGPKGSLYHAADSYMEKIAVGPDAKSVIDLITTIIKARTRTRRTATCSWTLARVRSSPRASVSARKTPAPTRRKRSCGRAPRPS